MRAIIIALVPHRLQASVQSADQPALHVICCVLSTDSSRSSDTATDSSPDFLHEGLPLVGAALCIAGDSPGLRNDLLVLSVEAGTASPGLMNLKQ